MKVEDVLKDKKAAWQKERLLDDDKLDSAVVDKLASDPSVNVRRKAVRHDKITEVGLWKVVTQKKNYEEEYMMSVAMRKLSIETRMKWMREKKYLEIEKKWIIDKFKYPLIHGIDESPFKDEFAQMLKDGIETDEFNFEFTRWWLIKYTDIKADKKLYAYFVKHRPDELVLYRERIGLTPEEVDKYFSAYVKKNEFYLLNPLNDFGSEFLQTMTGEQLTKLIGKKHTMSVDVMEQVKNNPNYTAEHFMQILKMDYSFYNKELAYIIQWSPLTIEAEKALLKQVKAAKDRGDWWHMLEAWSKNPNQSKEILLNYLVELAKDGSLSNTVIDNILSTGKYSEEDAERIFSVSSDYSKLSAFKSLVKNPNFPQNKLRALWKEYWVENWKKEEIPGPSYGDNFRGWNLNYDQANVHELIYNLVAKSSLAGEFGMEYYQEHKDEKYLPTVAKDIFMF